MEFGIDIYTSSKIRILVKTIGDSSTLLKVKSIIETNFQIINLDWLSWQSDEK